MTDEQMFAMDHAIASAFKSMGKAQREEKAKIETQKMNFKLRLLDVVELYMKRNSKSPDQFLFVKPLLKCAKSKNESLLSKKAGRIVSKVIPGEKVLFFYTYVSCFPMFEIFSLRVKRQM